MSKPIYFPSHLEFQALGQRLSSIARGEVAQVSLQNSELLAFEQLAQKAISSQLLNDEVALATRGMSFRPLFL